MSRLVIAVLVGAAIGAGAMRLFPNVKTEEKIVYKDRTQTVTKEIIVVRPDGTTVTEREIVKEEKKDQTVSKKENFPNKPDWGVSLKSDMFAPNPNYTLELHRRIFGNIYAGAYGQSNGAVGISVSLFF